MSTSLAYRAYGPLVAGPGCSSTPPPREVDDAVRFPWLGEDGTDLEPKCHWGQRKLLFSEIELLQGLREHPPPRYPPLRVVYAGAANGAHMPILHRMFPEVAAWELYDPAPFHPALRHLERVRLHSGFFTDAVAQGLVDPGLQVRTVFISDIRLKTDDASVSRDMVAQLRWGVTLRAEAMLLKFRLPFAPNEAAPASVADLRLPPDLSALLSPPPSRSGAQMGGAVPHRPFLYLDGRVLSQLNAPPVSAESRLLVRRRDADGRYPLRYYDLARHEAAMQGFNFFTRTRRYGPSAVRVPGLLPLACAFVPGMDNGFESACELDIMAAYVGGQKPRRGEEPPGRAAHATADSTVPQTQPDAPPDALPPAGGIYPAHAVLVELHRLEAELQALTTRRLQDCCVRTYESWEVRGPARLRLQQWRASAAAAARDSLDRQAHMAAAWAHFLAGSGSPGLAALGRAHLAGFRALGGPEPSMAPDLRRLLALATLPPPVVGSLQPPRGEDQAVHVYRGRRLVDGLEQPPGQPPWVTLRAAGLVQALSRSGALADLGAAAGCRALVLCAGDVDLFEAVLSLPRVSRASLALALPRTMTPLEEVRRRYASKAAGETARLGCGLGVRNMSLLIGHGLPGHDLVAFDAGDGLLAESLLALAWLLRRGVLLRPGGAAVVVLPRPPPAAERQLLSGLFGASEVSEVPGAAGPAWTMLCLRGLLPGARQTPPAEAGGQEDAMHLRVLEESLRPVLQEIAGGLPAFGSGAEPARAFGSGAEAFGLGAEPARAPTGRSASGGTPRKVAPSATSRDVGGPSATPKPPPNAPPLGEAKPKAPPKAPAKVKAPAKPKALANKVNTPAKAKAKPKPKAEPSQRL
jgi:hypothetical protein